MLIRFGYEITINCWQPTAVVTLLGLRDGREGDIRSPEMFTTTPTIPSHLYRDLFGNLCRRFIAPAGDLTFASDNLIEVSGLVDPCVPDAEAHSVADLPDDCLVYLMGSRYCETDRLSQLAWNTFGDVPAGWARAQAICDYAHERIRFDYQAAR